MTQKCLIPGLPLLLLLIGAQIQTVSGQEWNQWRGPDRDGIASAFTVPGTWPDTLTLKWKVEVGLGYATPLLVGDNIYVYARQEEDEVMLALDAATGDELWTSKYRVPFEMMPATRRHGEGPKSTPAYSDGRLFTLGISGVVTAWDSEDGSILWQQPASRVQPLYHTAQSPICVGEDVILHVGGHGAGSLTAFNQESGEIRWSWDGDGPAYGSPIVVELDDVKQIVTFTQEHLVGVDVETGELLWRRSFSTPNTTTSQTPITFEGDLIEAGRDNGITRVSVVREGRAWHTQDVWHTDEVSLHMANGIVLDGVLYGLSHLNSGQYFALDLRDGAVLWTSTARQADHASLVGTSGPLLSLEDDGELLVLDSSRVEFLPLTRYEVASSATWAQPSLSNDRIYVKDWSSLALWLVE